MAPSDLLRRLVVGVERLGIPDFVTGSMATIYYGEPRLTNDIDAVVALPASRAQELCRAVPPDEFYVSEEAARQAAMTGGQFNIIHPASGLKIDVMIPEDTPFNHSRFDRAVPMQVTPDFAAIFASPRMRSS